MHPHYILTSEELAAYSFSLRLPRGSRIRALLDDSLLPYKIDLYAYDLIGYPPLRAHIDAVAKTLLTQADLRAPPQDKNLKTRTPP